MKADLIVKGMIYLGVEDEPLLGMFAVKDGVYCYVGSEDKQAELQGEHTLVIRCENKMVLPDLVEGHAHVCAGIDLFRGVDLYGISIPEKYLEAINEYIEEYPDQEYIIGRGFLNGNFGTLGPTARMLDEVVKDKYIILDSEDCHSSWVNSKVMQAAGIDDQTKEMPNGVIIRYKGTNKPTGWLKEKEMDRVKKLLPGYEVKDYKEAILKYQEMAISKGIGCCYEPILNEKNDIDLRIQAYLELEFENKLRMQFRAGITMYPEDDIDTTLHKVLNYRDKCIGSHFELMGIKIFIDGVVEGHTAFLREPYADQPMDCGYNMWFQNKLNNLFVKAVEQDVPIHVHAIGDAALASAIEAFEKAKQVTGDKDLRNCVTHLQVVGEDQFEQLRNLGIIAVTNPFWHYKNPSYYDCLEVPFLGKERADLEYPMKSFFDHEVMVTQASDWPVTYNFDPFIGLETAVTRRETGNTSTEPLNEAQMVTVGQMLKALTWNGAYQMRSEDSFGSIEVHKKANFIIVDRNMFETPQEQLAKTMILSHYMDGIEVYRKEG